MEQITLHLTGQTPLLMHRPVTVNQLDPKTIELKKYTGKRKKTEDDHAIILRLDWEAGLYHDAEVGPYLPGVNIEVMLRKAGVITKQGTAIQRGVLVPEEMVAVMYEGPRGTNGKGLQELWDANLKDIRVVKNQSQSVMRCRPCFRNWEMTVPVVYEPSIIDERDLISIAERAGTMIGLGDYRPRFGRFTVEVV